MKQEGSLRTSKPGLIKALAVVALFATASADAGTKNSKNYTKTKYPIILSHGLTGEGNHSTQPSKPLLTDGWYGITQGLALGGAHVYEPDTSAVNGSNVRGEQLLAHLKKLNAIHNYGKFNLIGHSQGGFDIRYVASVRPDLVASVTVIGSPTFGSPFMDRVLDWSKNNILTAAAISIVEIVHGVIIDPNDPQDAAAVLNTVTTSGAREFNSIHYQGVPKKWCGQGKHKVNGVRYYSMSGTEQFTNWKDSADYSYLWTGSFIKEPNDGLVGRCASHLGKVLNDNYPWTHTDEINQKNGLIGSRSPNPVVVYRSHANRLKKKGL